MRLMMPQRELKSPGSWAGMTHRAGWIQPCNDLLLNVVGRHTQITRVCTADLV